MTRCLPLSVCRGAAAVVGLALMSAAPPLGALHAQSRPTAASDSIVRLAVDASRVRGVPFVALLTLALTPVLQRVPAIAQSGD